MADALEPVFAELRDLMLRSASGMAAATDEPGNLVVKTRWTEPGKKEPAWFGAVQRKKNYVSFHLMPVYTLPALRNRIPPCLEKRMQGKSCFNFKQIDPELFEELERLTAECAASCTTPVVPQPH